ncbi:hypothetical protein EVAR_73463_1 [Eumeta japonica]|uniref:Zinc finger BED domain-containing protein 4 n=1 Tax=Eumeta variegata TaxID=151549 RepID=A0A4C1SFB9_EUMVA|nr:hypothetical protein EVAR_73463_1 [Eumeta japonica]
MEVLTAYDINFDQVLTITTDNGADTIQATNDFNYEINTSSNGDSIAGDLICMDLDLSIDGISYVRSRAQTFQRCVTDVLTSTEIKEKLDTIRTIVNKLRTPLYLNWFRNENYPMPILDNSSRWTSTYRMLQRLIELKDYIEQIKHDAALEISYDTWHLQLNS